MRVFHDIQGAGMRPNPVTYCALISTLGKQRGRGGQAARLAYDLWRELSDSGLPLDAAAFRTGMNACIRSALPAHAVNV